MTSATGAPTAPELRRLDRMAGGLRINRWTYRLFRLLLAVEPPRSGLSGVSVSEEAGMLIVRPDTVRGAGAGAGLLFHGGGYVVGAPHQLLGLAASLASACGVPFFLPRYRLAPEHPFPAALDDCRAGWRWLREHAARLGVDPAKIVIGGRSAGGGLAAALAQRLRDEGGAQPAAQVLLYPMLDDRTAANAALDARAHRVWHNVSNRLGWRSYLGHAPGEPEPRPHAVPARCADLSGLPPAWIGVGTGDLFLDEDRAYRQRLLAAGVECAYVEVDGAIHGFDTLGPDLPLARDFTAEMVAFLDRFVR